MKKSILFFAALAALFSCSKENPVDNYNPADDTYSVTLTASAPTPGDTKTTLVDGGSLVHWSKGDAIKVLFFPKRSSSNTITGPSGVFTSHFDEESSAKAFFRTDSWSWAGISHDIYNDQRTNRLAETGVAVYPSTATAFSNKTTSSTSSSLSSEISFVLPEDQNAVVGNIESGLNFSYSDVNRDSFINTVDKGTNTNLYFKNTCALIQLTMPADMPKKVMSISITSNDQVALTGNGSLRLNYYKDAVDGGVVDVNDGKGIVLNSSNGFETGATYYAVVWPGVHNSGLTIEFAAEDGTVATKTTPSVTLTASMVKPYTFNKGLDFESAKIEEGDFIYADGTTGDNPASAVAVVFYKGKPQDIDPTVPSEYSRGLAISLKAYDVKWHTAKPSNYDSSLKYGNANDLKASSVGGYEAKTKWQSHNLVLYTSDYGTRPVGASEWYHGTHKEWNCIFASLTKINEKLAAVNGAQSIPTTGSKGYWIPFYTGANAWTVYWNGNEAAYTSVQWFTHTGQCNGARPIFAF